MSYVVGVGGGTGAGKTTLAGALADALDPATTTLSLDSYYREETGRENYDHPDAFDWPLLVAHLDALSAGEAVAVPTYDFTTHSRDGTERVGPAPVVLVEGILALHHDALRERLDLSVYVETDADVRALRRVRRDVAERGRSVAGVVEQYLDTVKPMHERFVAPTRSHADLVVAGGSDPETVAFLAAGVEAHVGPLR